MVGAPSMNIHGWKQLALWSLEYSCLSEADKERGKTIFLKSWKEFCEIVVTQYGGLGTFGEGEEKNNFTIETEKADEAYAASKNLVRNS
jgi:adenosine deaminase CECR1